MLYIINGSRLVDREALVMRVYDACADMPVEVRPVSACIGDSLKRASANHAVMIARQLGWNPVSVGRDNWYPITVKGHHFAVQQLDNNNVIVRDMDEHIMVECNHKRVAQLGGATKAIGHLISYML